MEWPLALFGAVVRSNKIPLVYWVHSISKGRHWVDLWARLSLPDQVIFTSRFAASSHYLRTADVPSAIIYCPVAESTCNDPPEAVRMELKTPVDAVVIMQVSRMESWKGQALHLQALNRIKNIPGWVCWLVGAPQRPHEAAYFTFLKTLAEELGIAERVRFLGQRTDVRRLLQSADIFCQPNEEPEPFGLVFIEALYSGIPVITTAMGGALEIVDDSCGILTEPDPMALAGAELELIANPILRRRLGAGAKSRARALCDVVTQINKIGAVLENLVEARDHSEKDNVNNG
jgi:glycosyltransferase involved in cell wall biosynthesis